jgi:hypothetical protein
MQNPVETSQLILANRQIDQQVLSKLEYLAENLDPFQVDHAQLMKDKESEVSKLLKEFNLQNIQDPHQLTRIILLAIDQCHNQLKQ